MSISYNGLWKLLIDKNMKKVDLINNLGISSSTIAKMTKGEKVSMNILEKICDELECDFGERHFGTGYQLSVCPWSCHTGGDYGGQWYGCQEWYPL